MKTFLATHDYGMGGVWMLIDAESASQIRDAYPELEVVEARPSFISDETVARLERDVHYDLASEPEGFLADLIERRAGRPS